jgi:hypothetical protein
VNGPIDHLLVRVTEVKAERGVNRKGKNVLDLLSKNDNRYLIMPGIRDRVELVFASPYKRSGRDRTVILKAGGYYDIHLSASGEPRQDIIEKLYSEPGFALKYNIQQYRI